MIAAVLDLETNHLAENDQPEALPLIDMTIVKYYIVLL